MKVTKGTAQAAMCAEKGNLKYQHDENSPHQSRISSEFDCLEPRASKWINMTVQMTNPGIRQQSAEATEQGLKRNTGQKAAHFFLRLDNWIFSTASENYRCKRGQSRDREACLMGNINEYPLLQSISQCPFK